MPDRIRVVAALVQLPRQPEYAWVFQRGPNGAFPGCWEFPGGKVEPGEDDRAALARELDEELSWKPRIGEHIATAYVPGHDVALYSCHLDYEGQLPKLHVHAASTHWRIKDLQPARGLTTPAMPFFLEVLSLRFYLHPLHFRVWQEERELAHFVQSESFNPYRQASNRQHDQLQRNLDTARQAWLQAGAPLVLGELGVPRDTRTWF